METYWKVTKITETESARSAEFVRTLWLIDNGQPRGNWYDFEETTPADLRASRVDVGGMVTLDVSDLDTDLKPGDDVSLNISVWPKRIST